MNFDEMTTALSDGKICAREVWGSTKGLVGCTFAGQRIGFAVVLKDLTDLHDEMGNMLRYFPTVEDRAAIDWRWCDCDIEQKQRKNSPVVQ